MTESRTLDRHLREIRAVEADLVRRDAWLWAPITRHLGRPDPEAVRRRLLRLCSDTHLPPYLDTYTTYVAAAQAVLQTMPRVHYAPDFELFVIGMRFDDLRLAISRSREEVADLPLDLDGLVMPFPGPGDRIYLARRLQLVSLIQETTVAQVLPAVRRAAA